MRSTAIIWLRADLRVHDHPALDAAAREHDRVVPLFVVDERLTAAALPERPRATRSCAAASRTSTTSLRARGAALVVRAGRPGAVVPALARELGAAEVLGRAPSRRSRGAATGR